MTINVKFVAEADLDNATIKVVDGKVVAINSNDNLTGAALSIDGTTLKAVTTKADGSTEEQEIDLSTILPEAVADKFLENVEYVKKSKSFKFTMNDGNSFDVPVKEFVGVAISQEAGNTLVEKDDGLYVPTVSGEKGEKGYDGADGKSAYDLWLEEGNTGSVADFLTSLKGADGEDGSGLDLSQIPEKAFETGSKILAFDNTGTLYQFGQNENVLTDVGITLSAGSASSVADGTVYTVSAKITNTSNTATGEVQVVIYTNSDLRNIKLPDGAILVDKTLTVASLDAYESKTVTFEVLITSNQYVSATVSTVGDMVSSNNTASLNLTAAPTTSSANNIFTEECPLIEAVMVGYESEPLLPSTQVAGAKPSAGSLDYNLLPVSKLGGVQLKLTGASSIVIKADNPNNYNGRQKIAVLKETGELTYDVYGLWRSMQHRTEIGPEYYTYDVGTGVLTFAENYPYPYATIIVRPDSAECKWQVFNVWGVKGTSAFTNTTPQIEVTGLHQSLYAYTTGQMQFQGEFNVVTDLTAPSEMQSAVLARPKLKLIGENIADFVYISDENSGNAYKYVIGGDVTTSSFLSITLHQGIDYAFTLTAPSNLSLPETQGNIVITNTGNNTYKVVVSENATATDAIHRDKLSITIV